MAQDTLHGRIMNLHGGDAEIKRLMRVHGIKCAGRNMAVFKTGHKEARHAAAELASEDAARRASAADELAAAVRAFDEQVGYYEETAITNRLHDALARYDAANGERGSR